MFDRSPRIDELTIYMGFNMIFHTHTLHRIVRDIRSQGYSSLMFGGIGIVQGNDGGIIAYVHAGIIARMGLNVGDARRVAGEYVRYAYASLQGIDVRDVYASHGDDASMIESFPLAYALNA